MSEWELRVFDDEYNLSGIVDKHPKLGKNTYMHFTSTLKMYSFEEDVLTYETENTIYKCPLKYINTKPYRNVIPGYKEELTKRNEKSDSILDKIIAAAAKISLDVDLDDEFVIHILNLSEVGKVELEAIRKAEEERLIEIAKQYDDCVYVEVSNIDYGDKLAYHIGETCGTVESTVNSGLFQDSILYIKYRQNEDDTAFDFRYFPKEDGTCMETHSWSDNIKQAVIKNICPFPIQFNGEEIMPEETKIFTPANHR